MSLTSYRAAPPRDPKDDSYNALPFPLRKFFREELSRGENGTRSWFQAGAGNQAGFSCRRALSMN